VVNLAEAVAAVVGTIAAMGLPAALGRLYFRHPDGTTEQRMAVGATIRLTLASVVAVGALSLVAGPHVMMWIAPRFSVPFYPFLALALLAAACVQLLQVPLILAQFQERPGRFVAISLSHFGLSTAAILTLVVAMSWGAYGMLVARAAGAAVVALVALWAVRGWVAAPHSLEDSVEALRLAAPLLPHQLVAFVLAAGNRFFIEHYRTTEEVGLYSMAYSVGMVMSVVTATMMMAWSPVFFRRASQGANAVRTLGDAGGVLIGGLVLIAAIGAVFGPLAVDLLLDARYAPAAPAVSLVIAGYLFHGMFSLFQLSVMQSGRTKYLAPVTAIAAVLSLGANLVLVPRLGFMGSAWATVAAYAVEAGLVYFLARRLFPVPYPVGRVGLWLLGFGVIVAVTQLPLGTLGTLAAGGAAVAALAVAIGASLRRDLRAFEVLV
jgi:O-antigen/teichoic acid export membrane protein